MAKQYAHKKEKKPLATRAKMIKFSAKLAEYICGEIEKGRTLTAICKEEGVPSHATIHKWVRDNYKDFGEKYQASREIQLNFFIDQMHDIADMPPPVPPAFVKNAAGEFEPLEGADRKLWVNAENMRRRLKVDAIKFQTAKLAGVMGQNLERGVTVQGDQIYILNYSTVPNPGDIIDIKAPEVEVKAVNFLEVKNERI